MEVLDDVGVASAIAARGTPAAQMAATAYYAGFAGPGPDYGRRLARLECWGAGGADDGWRAASPWRQLNLPQIRLEPLLKARAEELSPGRIRFGHELTGLEQDDEGVRATVRDNASGRRYVVRSQYLIGADGGRRVAGLVDVTYEGLGVITQTATLHVSADFSALGARSGRADPLDLLPAGRRPGGDGPDGAGAVGTPVGGVGNPPELPGRRSPGPVRRAGRSRRPHGAGHSGRAVEDPQDHALVGRGGAGLRVPGRPRVPARGRGAPPPAHRRAGPDQRDPRRAEPVLETGHGARRPSGTGAARHLPGRAEAGR